MSTDFVHLHNHSEYSLLDGACRVSEIIQWAIETSLPAVALTDHGNMFGAWEFYTKAREAGVKPIIGCEVYVAPNDRKNRRKAQAEPYHLTLLAENATGYRNLLKLVSLGYMEGFHEKPRIDMELLREHREGIIALTGCIQGQVPHLLAANRQEEAVQVFKTLIDVMTPRYLYVEIQNHYTDKELKAYPIMVDLAREFEIPLVATNNCHYLRKTDHRKHDVLLCIQTKQTVNDPDRKRFDNHYYFKSANEMREALKNYPPEAISNTHEIAKRCNLKLDYGKNVMPKYEVPAGHTNDSYLKELCYQGLRQKFGRELPSKVRKQINFELEIIRKTGYAGYFLIVWDYVKYANTLGYPISCRGSASSSLALYALDVNTFNPMDYDCMFERFLNTQRISPPDIDIDFADCVRDEVIEYLVNKYGHDSVGKVATFSTLRARAAITDVGRALEIPLENVRKLTGLAPYLPELTIKEIIKAAPSFRNLAELPEYQDLINVSREIIGMKRHISIHASAVVVSHGSLTDHVPLFTDNHGQIATQFDGETVEQVGIVKFDTLGSRSLTKTQNSIKMIKSNRGKEIRLEDVPFDDAATYQLASKGLIQGLFQLETSEGMRSLVMDLKAENFQDFVAIGAIYRPGPLRSGTTEQFIARKNGIEKPECIHPLLEDALKNTYGLCIYQEHVMQIARDMAGFTLGEADILRSAMGKVNRPLLKSQRQKFVKGAAEKGIPKKEANEIFDILEPFGGYAFNKSHSVAYALVTYRMAYLKTHYPHEFMASIMTSEIDDVSRLVSYRDECKELSKYLSVQINLLPPDINVSGKYFNADGDDISFGLFAIKNVGDRAVDVILEERKRSGDFISLRDFCERVDTRVVNKKTIESLILTGAFDSVEGHRAPLLANLPNTIRAAKVVRRERESRQLSLFQGISEISDIYPPQVETPEYEPLERYNLEKKLLGFYVSGHPLQEYTDIIEYYTTANSQTLADHKIDSQVFVVGMIKRGSVTKRKASGTTMRLTIEDLQGGLDVYARPDSCQISVELAKGQIIWVRGKVKKIPSRKNQRSGEQTENRRIYASEILDITAVAEQKTSAVEVTIPEADIDNLDKLNALREIALANKGKLHLILRLTTQRFGEVIVQCGFDYKIANDDAVFEKVENLFGKGSVMRSNRTKRSSKHN